MSVWIILAALAIHFIITTQCLKIHDPIHSQVQTQTQTDSDQLSLQNSNQFESQNIKDIQKTQMFQNLFYDTIVIGSGISGITAANQLSTSGQKVLVLQANNYIGGRMKTLSVNLSPAKNIYFQQGANWIHGKSKNNPLTQLANKVPNVKLIETDDQNTVTYGEDGKEIDKLVDKQWGQYQKIIQKIDDFDDISVQEAIRKINPSKLTEPAFMYHVANDIQFQTSADIKNLSAMYSQDDEQFDGDDYLVMSGFQKWVQFLAKNQRMTVLLNHSVSEVIRQSTKGLSIVKCWNGKQFQAKNIIIGVPLNVLKQGKIKFSPELPQWKFDSISRLQMGNICKILIAFKKQIYIEDKEQYIGIVSKDVSKRGMATYFLNLFSITKLPVLMTFGLGPNSDQLEKMPEQQLKNLLLKRLRIFIQTDIHIDDFDIYRTAWRSNNNFHGAYTYSPKGSTPKDWENIAKPIFNSKWYFCGQHTHSKYRGTVHGALLSGKNAARDILKEIKQKEWKYNGKS